MLHEAGEEKQDERFIPNAIYIFPLIVIPLVIALSIARLPLSPSANFTLHWAESLTTT